MFFRNALNAWLSHLFLASAFIAWLPCSQLVYGQLGLLANQLELYQTFGTEETNQMICVSWVNVSKIKDSPGYIHPGMAILDGKGGLVWYSLQPGWFQANDFRMGAIPGSWTVIRVNSADSMNYLVLNQHMEIISKFKNGKGVLPDAHEFYQFSSSSWLLSGRMDTILQDDSIPVRCFILEEIDEKGKVVWKWNSCDHIPPEAGFVEYRTNPGLNDYCHGNAAYRANDSLIVISMRNMNAILGIRYPEGTVSWQLGGKKSGFILESDPGFSGQHDCQMLNDSTIGLLDNGNMSAKKQSRVLVYRLDFRHGTAKNLYSYSPVPPVYIDGMGSADWHGDTLLMNFGRVFRPVPSIQLVAGQTVLRTWIFPDSVQLYRAHFCPDNIIPDRPTLTLQKKHGKLVLSAPRGFTSYHWNTGQKDRELVVSPGKSYQVWVPFGIGYLSSETFICPME